MAVDVSDSTGSGAAERLAEAADCLLELLGRSDAELSIMLVGDRRIRELNRDWRGKDRATDVLSFPQLDIEEPALDVPEAAVDARAQAGDEPRLALGDVVISVETAGAQAKAGGWTLEEELNRLLLHGVLHLLGYDHERGGEEERRMKHEELRLARAWEAQGHPCAREDA